MARNFTRLEIHTRARVLANLRSTSFPSNAEVNDLINAHYCEVYDLLVQAGPPEYFGSRTTVTTSSGTITYALPSDFRSLLSVYANESTDERRIIRPINSRDRGRYRAPQGTYSLTMEYIPAPTEIETSSAGDDTTVDGVSGWEELIVALVARDMLLIEGSPIPPSLEMKIDKLMNRIRTMSSGRDRGASRHIADVTECDGWQYPYAVGVRAYQLFGGYLELYEPVVPFP